MKSFCVFLLLVAVPTIASADAFSCSVRAPNVAVAGESAELLFPSHVAGGNCLLGGGANAVMSVTSVMSEIASSVQPTATHFFQGMFLDTETASHQQVKWYFASFPDSASNFGVIDNIDVFSSAENTDGQLSCCRLDAKQVSEPGPLYLTAWGLLAIGGMLRRRWFE
jgi:hypothetical protein